MSHCKSSASPLVLSTPSTDAVSTLAPRRAHVTDEVFRLPPPLRHREPLVLWEISIFVPSQPTADVANRFVAAVLKPSPLVRQHLAYQAPAKEREKRHENPDQMWLYFLIKVFEGRSSSLFVLRTRMKFASRKEGKGNISHAVSSFMNTSASRSGQQPWNYVRWNLIILSFPSRSRTFVAHGAFYTIYRPQNLLENEL